MTWIIVAVLLSTPGREGLDGFSYSHQVVQLIVDCVGEAEADDAIGVEYHPVTTVARYVRNHEPFSVVF